MRVPETMRSTMHIVRFGVVLFLLTTLLTIVLFTAAMLLLGQRTEWFQGGGAMASVQWLSVLTAPAALWATLVARRSRRRAWLSGIVVVIVAGGVPAILLGQGGGSYGYASQVYVWGSYIIGFACAIPSYLASMFVFRNSVAATPTKTKGPAVASP